MNKIVQLVVKIGEYGSNDSSYFLTNNYRKKDLIKKNN